MNFYDVLFMKKFINSSQTEDGLAGKWYQFNDTLTLPAIGTSWDVTAKLYAGNVEGMNLIRLTSTTATKSQQEYNVLSATVSMGGREAETPIYAEGFGWAAFQSAPKIYFIENGDAELTSWINANASETEPNPISDEVAAGEYVGNASVDTSSLRSFQFNFTIESHNPVMDFTALFLRESSIEARPANGGANITIYTATNGWKVDGQNNSIIQITESFEDSYLSVWLADNFTRIS